MTNAIEYTKGISYDEFVKDTKAVYAIIRAIEIWEIRLYTHFGVKVKRV